MDRKSALIGIGVVIALCYAVPYLVLGHVAAWYGSFLFWCIAGVAVIVLNVIATSGFGGDGE